MAHPPERSIREVLLEVVYSQHRDLQGSATLQQSAVLLEMAKRFGTRGQPHPALEQSILTEWNELFRTGLLAWGNDLNNPDKPFFHVTDRGRTALRNITRDPSNAAGYMQHLTTMAGELNPITRSYVVEALACYTAGLFKAAAVMIGAAAETVILDVRDSVVDKLTREGASTRPELKGWKIKSVTDALTREFGQIDSKQHRQLREEFDAYWDALAHQIRTTRNEVGHPTSIEPVTVESVHASLLVFPTLARLCRQLTRWADESAAR